MESSEESIRRPGWRDWAATAGNLLAWALIALWLLPLVERIYAEQLEGTGLPGITLWMLRMGPGTFLLFGFLGGLLLVSTGFLTRSILVKRGVFLLVVLALIAGILAVLLPLVSVDRGPT